ncbi:unnamed protein product [Colias eurytheme]|nr:unnamed protein product [Colias eurytheme]
MFVHIKAARLALYPRASGVRAAPHARRAQQLVAQVTPREAHDDRARLRRFARPASLALSSSAHAAPVYVRNIALVYS